MDTFIFASHSDTQGLVLAEAMASGVPIVALAAGARQRAQLYSREVCLQRLLSVYEQVLQRHLPAGDGAHDWDALLPRWQAAWKPIAEKLSIALRAGYLRPRSTGPQRSQSV